MPALGRAEPIRAGLEWALGQRFVPGNRIEVLKNGDQIFPAMLEAVERAERSVAFVTFVYWSGEVAERFAQAFARAARRGVRVQVLIDAFGGHPMDDELVEAMRAAGVELRWFRPLFSWRVWRNTHRTHRKVMVVDGKLGFTGGVGIAEEWSGDARAPSEWRDTHFRVRGPAVAGLWAAFAGNWRESDGALPDSGDLPPHPEPVGDASIMTVRATSSLGWSDVATLFDAAFALPNRRLWLATAYFVPDERTIETLGELVDRGVDVRILVPSAERSDKRVVEFANQKIIRALVSRGARLFRFQPAMFHAKIAIIDEELALIGSANLNHRSVAKDDEIVLAALDQELVTRLADEFEQDLARAREVDLDHLARRPWWHRLLARFLFRFRAEM